MKQIILPFILFLFIFQIGAAQVSLSLTPNPVAASGVADPDDLFVEIIGYATLKNEGTETVSIKWERVIVDMPEEWEALVCDFHQCYVSAVYSNIADNLGLNEPVVLAPGESSNLDVHAIPKGAAGSAEIRIDVSLTNEPDNILLSGTYTFNASLVSSSKDLNKAKLAVFPNPATDYVEVQGAPGAGRLAIYNVIGRQMRSFNLAPGSRYYVGDLPAGLYLASVLNKKGEILRTFRLSKRSLRP
ncbi:MAG: T9SS type A sorting domain-containing protein [Phaeodactylibacter sp.]|nr:T9SS type A sorting domain-containing protein [Phaeodactylibacter sp.]